MTWKARDRMAAHETLSDETGNVHFRAHGGRSQSTLNYLKADVPLEHKPAGGAAEKGWNAVVDD